MQAEIKANNLQFQAVKKNEKAKVIVDAEVLQHSEAILDKTNEQFLFRQPESTVDVNT